MIGIYFKTPKELMKCNCRFQIGYQRLQYRYLIKISLMNHYI